MHGYGFSFPQKTGQKPMWPRASSAVTAGCTLLCGSRGRMRHHRAVVRRRPGKCLIAPRQEGRRKQVGGCQAAGGTFRPHSSRMALLGVRGRPSARGCTTVQPLAVALSSTFCGDCGSLCSFLVGATSHHSWSEHKKQRGRWPTVCLVFLARWLETTTSILGSG